jgi:hypothetical protein
MQFDCSGLSHTQHTCLACVCLAISGSSSSLHSIVVIFRLPITSWIDCLLEPGVALSAKTRKRRVASAQNGQQEAVE